MRLRHLENIFPNLSASGYEKTSEWTGFRPNDGSYNCIAWAANDTTKWWWPAQDAYWPPWVKRDVTVACFVWTFRSLGYFECISSAREFGFEKVALYALHVSKLPIDPPARWQDMNDWVPKHMARQLKDGTWTSKIGPSEDIRHFTLDAVEAYGPEYLRAEYGCPVLYMKRFVPIGWLVRFMQHVFLTLQ